VSGFLDFLTASGGAAAELSILGGALQAAGSLQQGMDTQQAKQYQADQLRQNGGQAQASAQRTAADIDRQTSLLVSRALAVAAASGGGASDPTVVNMIAQDAAVGAYRKAVALYNGDEANRASQMKADSLEYEGKSAKVGGLLASGTSLLSGASKAASLYQKFGAGAPKS
jgi:hypothetical protein